jgi:hypothetical protein
MSCASGHPFADGRGRLRAAQAKFANDPALLLYGAQVAISLDLDPGGHLRLKPFHELPQAQQEVHQFSMMWREPILSAETGNDLSAAPLASTPRAGPPIDLTEI